MPGIFLKAKKKEKKNGISISCTNPTMEKKGKYLCEMININE